MIAIEGEASSISMVLGMSDVLRLGSGGEKIPGSALGDVDAEGLKDEVGFAARGDEER